MAGKASVRICASHPAVDKVDVRGKMKPLLYIGLLVCAVCSFTEELPGCRSDHRSAIEDEPTAVSMSKDEASRLLCETIIPFVDWPEQSIEDRLALIEQQASKVGLSLEMSPGLRNRQMTYPALCLMNGPFVVAIQAPLDSTILRVRIEDSGVLFSMSLAKTGRLQFHGKWMIRSSPRCPTMRAHNH